MTWFLLLAGAAALVYWMRRGKRQRRTARAVEVAAGAASVRPSWRDAREESDGLHIAVTALESHVGALQQIAEAWLMWANIWTHDPAHFRANVAYAHSIALRLEHDANEVVTSVGRLEGLRNGVALFDQRRAQAERLTDAAGLLSMALHARLHELASAQGAEAAALVASSSRTLMLPDRAWVQHRAATMADDHPLPLQEVVA